MAAKCSSQHSSPITGSLKHAGGGRLWDPVLPTNQSQTSIILSAPLALSVFEHQTGTWQPGVGVSNTTFPLKGRNSQQQLLQPPRVLHPSSSNPDSLEQKYACWRPSTRLSSVTESEGQALRWTTDQAATGNVLLQHVCCTPRSEAWRQVCAQEKERGRQENCAVGYARACWGSVKHEVPAEKLYLQR